jgi:hypothetical protein
VVCDSTSNEYTSQWQQDLENSVQIIYVIIYKSVRIRTSSTIQQARQTNSIRQELYPKVSGAPETDDPQYVEREIDIVLCCPSITFIKSSSGHADSMSL